MNDLTLREEICIEEAIYGDAAGPSESYADEIIGPVENVVDDLEAAIDAIEDQPLSEMLPALRQHVTTLRDRLSDACSDVASALKGTDEPYKPLNEVRYDLERLGFTIARVR